MSDCLTQRLHYLTLQCFSYPYLLSNTTSPLPDTTVFILSLSWSCSPSRHTVLTAAQFGSHLLLRLHLNLYRTPLSFYPFLMQLYYADISCYVLLFLNHKCTECYLDSDSVLFRQMLGSLFTCYPIVSNVQNVI